MKKIIKINPEDNVAVLLSDIKKNEVFEFENEEIIAINDIPFGHKIALKNINKNSSVVKYGESIGNSTLFINKGEHIHSHNLKTNLSDTLNYSYNPSSYKNEQLINHSSFNGFLRTDNTVGIRNEIWIIPTVGCVNKIAENIKNSSQSNSIISFSHPYGCSQMGDDQENTRIILSKLIKHPNAAGVLVVGLGCENSGIDVIKTYLGDYDKERIKFLNCQDFTDEISEGIRLIDELITYSKAFKRSEQDLSKLIIGMKCGGSDGFSGITANPLIGSFSDLFIKNGGSTILTEVPEMFGAETILMNRAKDVDVFNKTVNLINDFKNYYINNNQSIYENPSPGNKAGGITTLEEKSLGCTAKSGNCTVVDVLDYGETLKKTGLNLLNAPGNDLVASTALAASGAQIILFSTGRGTPFSGPVPTIKISSNSSIAQKKPGWIDFNAGELLENKDLDTIKYEFYNYVLSIANGEKIHSEKNSYHDLAIFKNGVTL